jgi:diadenosine tetraphosphate (Ap4A) HIT family hydrolase
VTDCSICKDNADSDEGRDPWLIARLQTGYVRLSPNQYFKGSLFFTAKRCVREVFDLERHVRDLHLAEMAESAAAVNDVFSPAKLNIESLGNGVPHLHWWITPRYETDPRPRGPIWEDLDFLRTQWTNGGRPTSDEFSVSRSSLLDALRTRDVTIELTT